MWKLVLRQKRMTSKTLVKFFLRFKMHNFIEMPNDFTIFLLHGNVPSYSSVALGKSSYQKIINNMKQKKHTENVFYLKSIAFFMCRLSSIL